MKLDFEVIIIGAGVAGMTAALYLKRANISCLLLEKEMPGGQINRTAAIENYPGMKNITGPELAENMLSQIQALHIDYQYGDVISLSKKDDIQIVHTNTKDYTCHYIIIASGRAPKKLQVENEEQLTGRGISWCAICDGPLYKGKDVCVVGGGNAAVEEAIYLSNICNSVTLIVRSDHLKAQKHLIDALNQKQNIQILYEKVVQKFTSEDNRLDKVIIEDRNTNHIEEIPCQGTFIYIGQIPNTSFITEKKMLDDTGYLIADQNQETNQPNIFACGDVVKKNLYQIVTATAEGAVAANTIINRIGNRKEGGSYAR